MKKSDLRGAARLATEATGGITDLVEAMHERIARLPGVPATGDAGRTRGVTGLVYKTVRGVTRVVGGGIDALLSLLPAGEGATSAPREAAVAALNGVLGDHLAATANPLATAMTFRVQGQALTLTREALAAQLPAAGPRVLVLIHGLCMNDLQWLREGHDHGAALARDGGYTAIYLHYNSGLHVSLNGQQLAQQLEQLTAAWPCRIERLVLLGHSMGGLLARSAQHQAAAAGLQWPSLLSDKVFLGTPHHGAPLERAGQLVTQLIGATPYAAPLARLARVRSAGITDLRHGNLLEADWAGVDRHARSRDPRQAVPLPEGVRCFAVASHSGERAGNLQSRVLGDGLVPLDSALGRHKSAARTLAFAPEHQWVGEGINHLALLSSPAVYAQLRLWLAAG